MRRAPLAIALLALLSCASGAVRLERYRGAYSTHFDGIPDQSEICAVVRNKSARPVEWLELRLESTSRLAAAPLEARSSWVYRGRIEPGARVALRFEHAPMADEIAVRVARVGRDARAPLNGRPLRLTEECSDEALQAALDAGLEAREATGAEVRAAARKTADPADELVAGP
jgi:hypothetical protein